MADYKELLRRAISALPENNGAARRAVYEKARSALVGQLRAINPPLPARDITQHRLQLEDCIRQVEQEASEANITLGRDYVSPIRKDPVPVPAAPVTPAAAPEPSAAEHKPEPEQEPEPKPAATAAQEPPQPAVEPVVAEKSAAQTAIEDIISAAEQAESEEEAEAEAVAEDVPDAAQTPSEEAVEAVEAPEPEIEQVAEAAVTLPKPVETPPSEPQIHAVPPSGAPRPVPSIVARNEPARPSAPTPPFPGVAVRPVERASFQPRNDALAANTPFEPVRLSNTRIEPSMGALATARQPESEPVSVVEPKLVETALSSVREVEVEPAAAENPTLEAEGVIERAIQTLDREARGEKTEMLPDVSGGKLDADGDGAGIEDELADTRDDRRGGGLTIFLIVFALLLTGVGGAGLWAWREGYVNLDQMFGRSAAVVADTTVPANPAAEVAAPTPTLDGADATDAASGPGNTAVSSTNTEATTSLEGLEPAERLPATPATPAATGTAAVPATPGSATPSTEERLPVEDPSQVAASDPAASVDPAVLAGSQSLLLEASETGRTGAVPFSGTVEWSQGTDELGLPTIKGKANIPARNLTVDLTIRKNTDASLPASHLMEINFQVSDTFIGGSIASLPGVLLKDEELVQGTPLVGASARIVGSSFLFALSAADKDLPTNIDLLTTRKWMDFAVIYGTGTRAIITLEKDDAASALFSKVFDEWGKTASQTSGQ